MTTYFHLFFALPFGAQLVIAGGGMFVAAMLAADALEAMRRRRRLARKINAGLDQIRRDPSRRSRVWCKPPLVVRPPTDRGRELW